MSAIKATSRAIWSFDRTALVLHTLASIQRCHRLGVLGVYERIFFFFIVILPTI